VLIANTPTRSGPPALSSTCGRWALLNMEATSVGDEKIIRGPVPQLTQGLRPTHRILADSGDHDRRSKPFFESLTMISTRQVVKVIGWGGAQRRAASLMTRIARAIAKDK